MAFRFLGIFCIAVAACALPARADLIFAVGSASVQAGTSGNAVDVYLTNTGGSGVQIGSFAFGLTSSSSGVSFDSVGIGTTVASYIFAGDSLFGPDILVSGGTSVNASDLTFSFADVTLGAGSTVGLGRVVFTVAPNAAAGSYAFDFVAAQSSLSDAMGATSYTIDRFDSSLLQVSASSVVPEASAFGVSALALGLAGLVRKRRASY